MKVAVFDDDLLTRVGLTEILQTDHRVGRSIAVGFEHVDRFGPDRWSDFDRVVVDLHDQATETFERGTDIYTGISVIEAISALRSDVTIVAITPTRQDPLLGERLVHSGAHFVYERWELCDPRAVADAIVDPTPAHAPKSHPMTVLAEEGLGRWSNPNRAVAVFKRSPLYGSVQPGLTQAAIGSRRAALQLRDQVVATGFVGTGPSPRWNEVRDYLLKLTGRLPVTPRRPGG